MEPIEPEDYIPIIKEEAKNPLFYRDLCSEFIGTLFLVAVASSFPQLHGTRELGSVVQIAAGIGFALTCLNFSLHEFGGCLLNPAVTLSLTITMKITVFRAAMYLLVECLGAIGGAAIGRQFLTPLSMHDNFDTIVPMLGRGMEVWQGVITEAWVTFILVLSYLASFNQRRKPALFMPSLVYGCAQTVGVLAAYSHTGAGMNPARSFGQAVMMGVWNDHWIYWLGPFVGSIVASVTYYYFLDFVQRPELEGEMHISIDKDGKIRLVKEDIDSEPFEEVAAEPDANSEEVLDAEEHIKTE